MSEGLLLTLMAVALGVAAVLAGGGLLRGMLYQVDARDPAVIAAVAAAHERRPGGHVAAGAARGTAGSHHGAARGPRPGPIRAAPARFRIDAPGSRGS